MRTPHPWTTEDDGLGRLTIRGAKERHGSVESQEIIGVVFRAERAEENAKLLATAPELLETLKAAFNAWFENPQNIEKVEPDWVVGARLALVALNGMEPKDGA